MDPQNNMSLSPESKSSTSTVIGVVVVIVVVILGALYFWNARGEDAMMDSSDQTTQEEAVRTIESQSQSDDTSSIEADLETTDIDGLDTELNAS